MRKILLFIFSLSSIVSMAYNLENVDKALQEMSIGHHEQSITMLKKMAAVNDVSAQYYLGNCYEHGIVIEADPKVAFGMYRRAAERGFPPAMFELSRCYSEGIGVEQNQSRADEWMERYNKKSDNSTVPNIVEIYANSQHTQNIPNGENIVSQSPDNSNLTESSKRDNNVTSQFQKGTSPIHAGSIKKQPEKVMSDVDIDIPKLKISNSNLFALIIANENYQDVASVPYALNDGETFAKYCQNTLGIPETNIHLVKDATLNNIKRELNLMKKIAEAFDGDASFIVYYAGYGIPDEKTRDSFLMPIDGFPGDVSTCFSLNDFYKTLSSLPSSKTIVLLDACFSGASREGGMLVSARGVTMRPKSPTPSQNLLVISSASGDETSYPYEEKKHGLFTYFLLKKLKESQGNASIGSLMDYIYSNVTKTSIVVNGKSQTPVITPSSELGDDWMNWKLK